MRFPQVCGALRLGEALLFVKNFSWLIPQLNFGLYVFRVLLLCFRKGLLLFFPLQLNLIKEKGEGRGRGRKKHKFAPFQTSPSLLGVFTQLTLSTPSEGGKLSPRKAENLPAFL